LLLKHRDSFTCVAFDGTPERYIHFNDQAALIPVARHAGVPFTATREQTSSFEWSRAIASEPFVDKGMYIRSS
jgi:hypothetical protein